MDPLVDESVTEPRGAVTLRDKNTQDSLAGDNGPVPVPSIGVRAAAGGTGATAAEGASVEFAIAQGFDLGPLADRVGELAFSTVDIAGHRVRAGTVEVVSTRPAVTAPDGSVRLFAGYASYDGEFVHPLLEPSDASVERVVDAVLAGREPDGGLFAAVRLDASGVGRVEVDPLGQYPLYYLRRGRDFVVSNNPHFVDAAVRSRGPGLTRSVVPAIDNIVYGGPLSGATMYEEVSWLLVGQSLRFDERGLQLVDGYPEYLHDAPEESPEELVGELVDAMLRHTVSVARAVPDGIAVADATGGHDSRTVLAVLASSGRFPDLTGRCITRHPNPDANSAGAVMEHLGLRPGPYPIAGRGLIQRQVEGIASAAYQHGGARDAVVQLPFELPDFVHFTGCFGELGGGQRPGRRGTLHQSLDAFLEHRARVGATSLMTGDAIAHVRDRLSAEMEELYDAGVLPDDVGVEIYLRSRSKSLYGILNFQANLTLVRPDILANPLLARLRRALPRAAASAHRSSLDLILATRPDLAFLPMLEPWDSSIVPAEHRARCAAMEPVDASTPSLSGFDGRLWYPVPVEGFARDDPHTGHESAAEFPSRERFPQAPNVVGNQVMLRELLTATPAAHTVWSLVDRAAVEQVVRRDPHDFRSGVGVTALSRVAAAITWMLGEEVPDPVTARLSMRALCEDRRRQSHRTEVAHDASEL